MFIINDIIYLIIFLRLVLTIWTILLIYLLLGSSCLHLLSEDSEDSSLSLLLFIEYTTFNLIFFMMQISFEEIENLFFILKRAFYGFWGLSDNSSYSSLPYRAFLWFYPSHPLKFQAPSWLQYCWGWIDYYWCVIHTWPEASPPSWIGHSSAVLHNFFLIRIGQWHFIYSHSLLIMARYRSKASISVRIITTLSLLAITRPHLQD